MVDDRLFCALIVLLFGTLVAFTVVADFCLALPSSTTVGWLCRWVASGLVLLYAIILTLSIVFDSVKQTIFIFKCTIPGLFLFIFVTLSIQLSN